MLYMSDPNGLSIPEPEPNYYDPDGVDDGDSNTTSSNA